MGKVAQDTKSGEGRISPGHFNRKGDEFTHASWGSRVAIVARLIMALLLGVGGVAAGSIVLLADALTNFSILLPRIVSIAARRFGQPQEDERIVQNYSRVETAASLIGHTALILIGAYLFYEGSERFFRTVQPNGFLIVALGGLSFAANLMIALFATKKGKPQRWPSFSNNLMGLLVPLLVVGSGIAVMQYQSPVLDPLIGIIVVIYLVIVSLKNQIHAIRTFTDGRPADLVPSEVIERILAVEGVADTHHVHFWQMGLRKTAIDAHVVVNIRDWSCVESIRDRVEAVLLLHCGVTHITLEMELPDREKDEMNIYGN